MAAASATPELPCSMLISIPLPTARLASVAMRSIGVDKELSPLVRRTLTISPDSDSVLQTQYQATTNRMLRVAVNSFMDSLSLVLEVMEELDVDVLDAEDAA